MLTVTAALLGLVIIAAVLGFTAISGPYAGTARIVSYSLLILFSLVLVVTLIQQCQVSPQASSLSNSRPLYVGTSCLACERALLVRL